MTLKMLLVYMILIIRLSILPINIKMEQDPCKNMSLTPTPPFSKRNASLKLKPAFSKQKRES